MLLGWTTQRWTLWLGPGSVVHLGVARLACWPEVDQVMDADAGRSVGPLDRGAIWQKLLDCFPHRDDVVRLSGLDSADAINGNGTGGITFEDDRPVAPVLAWTVRA